MRPFSAEAPKATTQNATLPPLSEAHAASAERRAPQGSGVGASRASRIGAAALQCLPHGESLSGVG